MDDKEKKIQKTETPSGLTDEQIRENEQKISDMKQELEDYIEEQGIYIRQ